MIRGCSHAILRDSGFVQETLQNLAGAEKIHDATLEGDYEYLVDHMVPSVIESMGGRDNAIGNVRTSMRQLDAQGLRISEFSVSAPDALYYSTSEVVVFIPTQVVVVRGET